MEPEGQQQQQEEEDKTLERLCENKYPFLT